MTKKFKLIFSICLFVIAGLAVRFAFAQDFGTNEINSTIGLSQTDPRIIVGKIIQIALSFLGVIALLLTIYAGFIWMTSNGEEEKVGQAKKILKNAVIGLVIVLSAWSITTFVLNRLADATGAGDGYNPTSTGNNISNIGLGAIGACTVESFYPESGQEDLARNTSIMVSFKEELALNTICIDDSKNNCACDATSCNRIDPETFRLYKSDLGDACSSSECPSQNTNITDILVAVSSDNKTIILSPLSFLGSADNNTWYTMKIGEDLKNASGVSVFKTCSSNNLQWDFEVSTNLDLTPPVVPFGKIFPLPDNERDIEGELAPAQSAFALINVNDCPQKFSSAELIAIDPTGPQVSLSYHGDINMFKVLIPNEDSDKAQLFNGNDDSLLGIADFNDDDLVVFPGYFSFQVSDHQVGNLWSIEIKPEELADTLTVGSMLYTFSNSSANNNILVEDVCSVNQQAIAIQAKLSGHPEIRVDRVDARILLIAKVAGKNGNNITIGTTNTSALSLTPFSGGINQKVLNKVNDQRDNPMNSVIQINFNEAINPMTVAGTADEVSNYIRVANASAESVASGAACSADSECLSYSCENGSCQGDYLDGRFLISNVYRTVEFISNDECGVNGCGETIYCLPANSNLAVELMAANFKTCEADSDCASFAPFNICAESILGYKTCQDQNSKNYPVANPTSLDGIVDASTNSLDGNRDTFADGPVDFFNENYKTEISKKDKYRFSFNVSDQISLDPPRITAITPSQGQGEINLADPIRIDFNSLMMNSSLKTGRVVVDNGNNITEHKLLNLRSSSPEPLGFWISSENKDVNPLDGVPDLTTTYISHTPFAESSSYKAQVGSGVKDIFQNCFKPSAGPSCSATQENPSCCFGNITNTLGSDGNCQ